MINQECLFPIGSFSINQYINIIYKHYNMSNCYYNDNVSNFPYPVYVDNLVVNVQTKIIISIILVKFSLGNYEEKKLPFDKFNF